MIWYFMADLRPRGDEQIPRETTSPPTGRCGLMDWDARKQINDLLEAAAHAQQSQFKTILVSLDKKSMETSIV